MCFQVHDIVSAEDEDGNMTEGEIIDICPFGRKSSITIVIEDHENGEVSHWRPEQVTRLSDGYCPSTDVTERGR